MSSLAVQLSGDVPNASGLAGLPTERGYYRPDIEGLRAVAVLAVVLYHAGIAAIPGGFVGVDVFYVISGFLITGLLLREQMSVGRINLQRFYARRMRRLLPAALVVIVATLVASYFLISSVRFPQVAGDAAAAAAYVSNYRFALNATDYLAAADPSPLLHYWSLGVEEQFYLVWPLLLIASVRFLPRRWFGVVLVSVGAMSLVASIVWTDIAQPWAFFSLPTRAWELATGALLAVSATTVVTKLPSVVLGIGGLIGLALILGSVALITGTTPFPGLAAIVPVIGAALVVLAGESRATPIARFLAAPILRWMGRISYSLYLWHWPLLILLPLLIGRDDLVVRLVIVVIAILVAELSTRWIEMPFRDGRVLRLAPGRSIAAAGTASLCVVILAIGVGGGLSLGESHGNVTADLDLPTLPPLRPITTARPSTAGVSVLNRSPSPAPPSPTLVSIVSAIPTGSSPPSARLATPEPALSPPHASGQVATSVPNSQAPSDPPALSDSPAPSDPPAPSASPAPSGMPEQPTPQLQSEPPSSSPTETPGPSVAASPTGQTPSLQPTPTVAPPALPLALESGPLPNDLVPSLANAADDLPVVYTDGCHLDFGTTESPPCVFGDPTSQTTAILFGDSHAAQWLPALQRIADANDWRLESLTKSGCPPVPLTVWNAPLNRPYRECNTWRQNSLERIEAEHPTFLFVASARDYQVVDDQGVHAFNATLDTWRIALAHVLARLRVASGRVVLLGETPRFDRDPVACLAKYLRLDPCTKARSILVDSSYSLLETDAAAAAAVNIINANDWLCPDRACPLVFGRYLVYRDTTHITATFMEVLAERLEWALSVLP